MANIERCGSGSGEFDLYQPPENIGRREKNGKCTPKERAHRSRTLVGMTFTQAPAAAIRCARIRILGRSVVPTRWGTKHGRLKGTTDGG